MFKRRSQPAELSAEEHSRLDRALTDLAAVDPKARSDLDYYLGRLEGLWQLLVPMEQINWVQNVMICTGQDGQLDKFSFTHGVLALTDQHLVFTGSSPEGHTRNGRWDLTEIVTADLGRERGLGDDVLLIGSGSAPTGFATKHRSAASQELLRRLRAGIARARAVPAETQAGGSTADELAKWAKLRDDGSISDEEFAAQKAKLLGQ
jgi:hypothetical protein